MNCSQKIGEILQNIEGIIKPRDELLKKLAGVGGVYLLKTMHKESLNEKVQKETKTKINEFKNCRIDLKVTIRLKNNSETLCIGGILSRNS